MSWLRRRTSARRRSPSFGEASSATSPSGGGRAGWPRRRRSCPAPPRRARQSRGAPSTAGHAPSDLDAPFDEGGDVEERPRLEMEAGHAGLRGAARRRRAGRGTAGGRWPRAAERPRSWWTAHSRTSRGSVEGRRRVRRSRPSAEPAAGAAGCGPSRTRGSESVGVQRFGQTYRTLQPAYVRRVAWVKVGTEPEDLPGHSKLGRTGLRTR